VSARCTAATRREPPGLSTLSLREDTGIAAGGRRIEDVAAGGALVALTKLAKGSPLLASAPLGSAAFASTGLVSTVLDSGAFVSAGVASDRVASVGRGRGNGLFGTWTGAGIVTIVVEPACLEGEDEKSDAVAVSVRDQGEGISPDVAPRVFRQFWRGKPRGGSRRGQHGGGTGLGLYIVKGLVEAHGGTICVRRAPGGGAEFRFTVPAGTAAA